jgi:hypothetical protein
VEPCAVVSCHVEQPLDDRCWQRFAALQRRAPGGFRIAALMRPPHAQAGEDEERWLGRAREAAIHGPFGHHAHFVSPGHARPPRPGPEHAERLRREAAWLREHGLRARFFAGGGWFIDEGVARAAAEAGYVDCTATSFRPAYLPVDAPRLELAEPAWLDLGEGSRLLELPATHSLGMALRAVLDPAPLPALVHVYFHDTELLSRPRRLALELVLRLLARRRRPSDLDRLADEAAGTARATSFRQAASASAP